MLPKGAKPPPPSGSGVAPLSGGFSAARRGTTKCNFTATPQAGKERFSCLFQMNSYLPRLAQIGALTSAYYPKGISKSPNERFLYQL